MKKLGKMSLSALFVSAFAAVVGKLLTDKVDRDNK